MHASSPRERRTLAVTGADDVALVVVAAMAATTTSTLDSTQHMHRLRTHLTAFVIFLSDTR
jgi:hypothetical protein